MQKIKRSCLTCQYYIECWNAREEDEIFNDYSVCDAWTVDDTLTFHNGGKNDRININ